MPQPHNINKYTITSSQSSLVHILKGSASMLIALGPSIYQHSLETHQLPKNYVSWPHVEASQRKPHVSLNACQCEMLAIHLMRRTHWHGERSCNHQRFITSHKEYQSHPSQYLRFGESARMWPPIYHRELLLIGIAKGYGANLRKELKHTKLLFG